MSIKTIFYKIVFGYKVIEEKDDSKSILESAQTTIDTIKQRRSFIISTSNKQVLSLSKYTEYYDNIELTNLYNNFKYVIDLFENDSNLNIDILDNIIKVYLNHTLEILQKIKKCHKDKTQLLKNNLNNFIKTLNDIKNQQIDFNNNLKLSKSHNTQAQYNYSLKNYMKVLFNDEDDYRLKNNIIRYETFDIFCKPIIYNITDPETHSKLSTIIKDYKPLIFNKHFLYDERIKDVVLNNNFTINYVCTFSINTQDIEHIYEVIKLISDEELLVFINKKQSMMYIVDDMSLVDDILSGETKENWFSSKINKITQKISETEIELKKQQQLPDDICYTFNLLNKKLMDVNYSENEDNYDLELQQLTDLINSDLV